MAGLLVVSFLVYRAAVGLVVGSLTDRRVAVEPDVLARAVEFFPKSARLQWRLADAELSADDADLAEAKTHAELAVELSPRRFQYRQTLATLQEAMGDRQAAEASLRAAVGLAPNDATVRWQFANLLYRKGDLPGAVEQFTIACDFDRTLLPSALGLLWDPATNNWVSNIDAIRGVVPNDPASQILFARFLADQGRPVEAARVFKNVEPHARLESGQTPAFIDLLMSDGTPALAKSVWANQSGVDPNSPNGAPIVWDGGFESSPAAKPSLFEWRLRETKYARISVDRQAAHNGSRSLRIEFAGIDTTRLDGEITQTIVLNPATRYRLSFYVKTDSLVSPEGPRVAVGLPGSDWHVVSSPIPTGSEGWTMMSFSFTTPAGSEASSKSGGAAAGAGATSTATVGAGANEREHSLAAVLSIVRKPAFSYDDPTRGSIWFDDFSITEEKGQQ